MVKGKSAGYEVGDLIYDASIYDAMNSSLDDLEFYRKWMPKKENSHILELCCGTGRLTIPLAEDGYHITGVDFTSTMLAEGSNKAKQKDLKIKFINADVRSLSLQEKFDLIFIPFNSIHHLYKNEDLISTFQVVQKHLKKGGLFLLDCYNPNLNYIVEAQKDQSVLTQYQTDDGRTIRIEQNMNYESASQINRIQWHYFIDGQFDSIQNLDMRMYFPQELDYYLEQNGFAIDQKFGDFKESNFNNESEKQIYVCRKKI
ncbi:methyltransferase family protein [Nonlabens dokdonensis]|uniref:Methyltransferase family protein n=2 Tax=Nonlabens dokdonensis TaxID=328515 RepID=A0ABX5PXP8_9FLAO|nr:class I SAM-dependent methyltransferase [Nonlabens dokdonensis]AGC77552.1 putative methyltransferase [Nonlabens dokdonensis DSW-6]PZX39894.1 methyltransferase family protein [Nonlabens dokdonensis]